MRRVTPTASEAGRPNVAVSSLTVGGPNGRSVQSTGSHSRRGPGCSPCWRPKVQKPWGHWHLSAPGAWFNSEAHGSSQGHIWPRQLEFVGARAPHFVPSGPSLLGSTTALPPSLLSPVLVLISADLSAHRHSSLPQAQQSPWTARVYSHGPHRAGLQQGIDGPCISPSPTGLLAPKAKKRGSNRLLFVPGVKPPGVLTRPCPF